MGKLTHWVIAEALCLVVTAGVLPIVIPPQLRADARETVPRPFSFTLPRFVDATSSHCGGDRERRYDVDAALRSDEALVSDGGEPEEGAGPPRRRYVRPPPDRGGVIHGRTLLVREDAVISARRLRPRPRADQAY